MIYLVLSSLCLALLYGVYRLAMSRTTLHRFNRTILLSIIVLSAILPAIRIDALGDRSLLHENDAVWVSPLQAEWREEAFEYEPVEEVSAPVEILRADVRTSVATGVKMAEAVTQMDWVSILTYLYLMGVAFFMIRLLIGITRAETLCRLGGRQLPDGSRLLVCDGEFQPTSWRRTVIISRRDFESDQKDLIIEHELTHIHCHHSIDVVISQITCALQWFNPAAWALKRSLQEVHEYEADATVLADGFNEREYQICLVQAALNAKIGYVTSNFADCSTKKRIKMMKRGQSSPFVCLRALLLLPVALIIILLASACKSDAGKDSDKTSDVVLVTEEVVAQTEPADTAFLKTVPPPPLPESKYQIDYNLNYETDKWVKVRIDDRNNIYMDAYNVTRTLSSAQEINPTLEKLGIPGSTDSVAVEIKADNTIRIKIPHIVKTFDTSAELKKELNILYPDATDAVYWKLIFDVRCSSRVENEIRDFFNEEPYKDRQVRIVNATRIYPPNMTHQDSIDYIIFQKDGGSSGRKRHVKNMKWYNDNKDKEEFFRMGFVDGKLCVCKGNDPSKLQPIEFEELVPYFKENCPDGNERSAIVLFEIVDTEGVPVTYIDQVLTKMEGWITTFTKRLYLSPKHIE